MGRNNIGTQRETSLHAALKQWYAKPGDKVEVEVDRYVIDIVRGEQLIEIQTGNFHVMKPKLRRLLPDFELRIVHPIPRRRWIQRIDQNNKKLTRRKSPKRGRIEEIFHELVGVIEFLDNDNLQVEALLISEEVSWRDDGRGSWRRKRWSIADRQLLEVHESLCFRDPVDYVKLIPAAIEQPFTNADLSRELLINRRLAERMTYCMRKMGILTKVGQKKRFHLYSKT